MQQELIVHYPILTSLRHLLLFSVLLLAACGGAPALDRSDAEAVARAWLAAVEAEDDATAQGLYFNPDDPYAPMRGQGTVNLYRSFINPEEANVVLFGALTEPPALQHVAVVGGYGAAYISLPYAREPRCAELVMQTVKDEWGVVGVTLGDAQKCEL